MKQKRKHSDTVDVNSKQNPHTVTVSQISTDIIWQVSLAASIIINVYKSYALIL